MDQIRYYPEIKNQISDLIQELGVIIHSQDESSSHQCLISLHHPLKFSDDKRAPVVQLSTGRVFLYPVFIATTRSPVVLPYSKRQVHAVGVQLEEGTSTLLLNFDLRFHKSEVEVPAAIELGFDHGQILPASKELMKQLIKQFADVVNQWGVNPL